MHIKLDDIKKLHQKKYRIELGVFLVEGEHLVLELEKAAQYNKILQSSTLYVTEPYLNWPSNFKKNIISPKQMAQISDTKNPQGIVAVVPLFEKPLAEEPRSKAPLTEMPFVEDTCEASPSVLSPSGVIINPETTTNPRTVYLYEIQDPGNLGTILRTLAWFGGFRLLLSPGSVDPYNPKVVRASMGAILHVPMELDVPISTLTHRFNNIACLDLSGRAISNSDFKKFDCYLFGNEARGIPHQELSAIQPRSFTISGKGAVESLNLASAVNICIYELTR